MVRASPGASRDEISGIYRAADGSLSLKVHVRAQPEKGKANKAVIALLAKRLGIARSLMSVTGGCTARNKKIAIQGNLSELRGVVGNLIEDLEDG